MLRYNNQGLALREEPEIKSVVILTFGFGETFAKSVDFASNPLSCYPRFGTRSHPGVGRAVLQDTDSLTSLPQLQVGAGEASETVDRRTVLGDLSR